MQQFINGAIAMALLVASALLLISLLAPQTETVSPVNVQAVENSDIVPGLQNSADRLPPGKQTVHELAVNPDTVVNNDLQSAPVSPPLAAAPQAAGDSFPGGDGPFSISGLVVDEAGRGVPGIEVLAAWKNLFQMDEDPAASRSERERKALTDFEGFYEIQGLNDGEYRIGTQADDRYEAAQAVVRAGVETADLVLREWRPEAGVFGTVRGDDGEPLDSVEVQAVGQSDGTVHTNGDGFYELTLEVSRSKPAYTLQFVREGYREKRSVLELQEMERPGKIRVDAELEPIQELVEVSASVHNRKGKPVAGESVQLYSEAARQRYTAVSDSNGEVWFEEVETSSDYSLAVYPTDSYRDFSIRGVEITLAGADLEIVLEPLALGSLTGQMVDPEGKPVPEFSMWLRNPDAINQAALLVTGDQQGFFEVDQVEEGVLIFETHSSPLYSISGIHLSAGEEKDIRLVLDWGNHQVAGLVLDNSGAPVTASELFVTSLRRDSGMRTHAVRRAITDEEGYFLFTQVGPGYHTIRVDVPGFGATVLDHDVRRDNTDVVIRLE